MSLVEGIHAFKEMGWGVLPPECPPHPTGKGVSFRGRRGRGHSMAV